MLALKQKPRFAMLLNLNEELGLKPMYPDLPTAVTCVDLFLFNCQSAIFQAFRFAPSVDPVCSWGF